MDVHDAHARYRELLYHHGYGYPFWAPETRAAQSPEGISIGDVGILTDDGGFEYLWNIRRSANDYYNKSGVPANSWPLRGLLAERTLDHFYPKNTTISSANVQARGIKVEGNGEPAGLTSGSPGGRLDIEFSADGDSGAILVLPQGGSRVDAVNRDLYQQYAAQNAEAWFHHLIRNNHPGLRSGSLYLVTGTDKCSSWGIASFANPSVQSSMTLKFSVLKDPESAASATNKWSVDAGVDHCVGPAPPHSEDGCVFARGFVIVARDTVWAEDSDTRDATTSIEALKRGMHSDAVSRSPAAILANALLEQNSTASFAVVHDDNWIVPTKRGDLAHPSGKLKALSLQSLKEHAASLGNVVVANRVCTLPEPDSKRVLWHGVEVSDTFKKVNDAVLFVQQHSPPNVKDAALITNLKVSKAVEARSDVKPRLFALVIGIDKYKDAKIRNLRGAVADADAVVEFLTTTLGVDRNRIRNLRNHEATRAAILNAISFLKSSESGIERDDPILIYYAGHGAEAGPSKGSWDTVAPAPIGWEAGGRNAHIQMILPHDFSLATSSLLDQQGILDLVLAECLSELAQKKGDNITVIFDCCHSGHATRDPLGLHLGLRGIELPPNYAVLEEPKNPSPAERSVSAAPKSTIAPLASHVLLAACSQNEYAGEIGTPCRGLFTTALLKLLRRVELQTVTYSDVISRLDDLPVTKQHPQCVGDHRTRVLFSTKSPRRSILYPVTVRSGFVVLEGGQAQGIAQGAEFDILAAPDINSQPACRLMVSSTSAFSAILGTPTGLPSTVPEPAWAVQTATGRGADLDVALDPVHQFLDLIQHVTHADVATRPPIRFVDPADSPPLVVGVESDHAVFILTDQICLSAELSRLPHKVPLYDIASIYAVVESAAHFFYHLHRSNPATPLAHKVAVEAFELDEKYNPHTNANQLTPRGPNLVEDLMLQVKLTSPDEKCFGFKLTSELDDELFINAFLFDVSQLAIHSLYQSGGAKKMAEPSILPKGSLTLGYGSGGAECMALSLPKGVDVDVTFLKIFITTKPVDLSNLPCGSPFDPLRTVGVRSVAQKEPVWDSILLAVVQKKA